MTAARTGTSSKAEEPRPNHKINNLFYTDNLTSSRMALIASTLPSRTFGTTDARPDSAARAAE